MWEELAEDPFRGLRGWAGYTSPHFCFLPITQRPRIGIRKPLKSFKMSISSKRWEVRVSEENTKR